MHLGVRRYGQRRTLALAGCFQHEWDLVIVHKERAVAIVAGEGAQSLQVQEAEHLLPRQARFGLLLFQ